MTFNKVLLTVGVLGPFAVVGSTSAATKTPIKPPFAAAGTSNAGGPAYQSIQWLYNPGTHQIIACSATAGQTGPTVHCTGPIQL